MHYANEEKYPCNLGRFCQGTTNQTLYHDTMNGQANMCKNKVRFVLCQEIYQVNSISLRRSQEVRRQQKLKGLKKRQGELSHPTRVYVPLLLWVVSKDMERDIFMSATEAQTCGIVDLVSVE